MTAHCFSQVLLHAHACREHNVWKIALIDPTRAKRPQVEGVPAPQCYRPAAPGKLHRKRGAPRAGAEDGDGWLLYPTRHAANTLPPSYA